MEHPMTTIMIRAGDNCIPSLPAKGHSVPGYALRRFVMPSSDQYVLRLEEGVRDATDQVPLQISVESVPTCNAQAHAMIDAITAMVTNAQAGLNWLRAQPLNLEEVEQALNNIANDGKRACGLVAQLRAAMKVPTQQGAPDS
jgi:hypothetical protein